MNEEVGEPPPSTVSAPVIMEMESPRPDRKPVLYTATDHGPFLVIVTKLDGSTDLTNLHPMLLGRHLYGHKDLHIQQITRRGRYKLEILFTNYTSANTFVLSSICTPLKLRAFIPLSKTCVVGVIKGIPTDFKDSEILQEARTEVGTPIKEVYRFTRRVTQEDGTVVRVPTQSIKVTFLGQVLPQRIFIYNATAPVEKYTFPIKQCNNCQNYGHFQSFCHNSPSCGKCSGPHPTSECTSSTLKCKHCQLPHLSTDKKCPAYGLQTKYSMLMTEHNISFLEARDVYQGNTSLAQIVQRPPPSLSGPVPGSSQRSLHFPPLSGPPPPKRKLAMARNRDSAPSAALQQVLLAPSGRLPTVPRSEREPRRSLPHLSPRPEVLSSGEKASDSGSSSLRDIETQPPTTRVSQDTAAPSLPLTASTSSYPSFKLIDMTVYSQILVRLQHIQQNLPDPLKAHLDLIIKDIKLS